MKNDTELGFVIVGIASNDVCKEDVPRIYTRAHRNVEWIVTKILAKASGHVSRLGEDDVSSRFLGRILLPTRAPK